MLNIFKLNKKINKYINTFNYKNIIQPVDNYKNYNKTDNVTIENNYKYFPVSTRE